MTRVKLFVIDEKPYLGSTEEIFVGDEAIVTVNGQYPMIVKCENEIVLNLIKDPKLTLTRSFKNPDGSFNSANILGVNSILQGAEFDFTYRPSDKLSVIGMLSLGDWTWDNDVTNDCCNKCYPKYKTRR